MAFDPTKDILRNNKGEPVPQVWDDVAQTFVVYEGVAKLVSSIETVNSAPVVGRKTVTATAAEIFAGGSVKASRRKLVVRNEDPVMRLRVGPSGMTQQNGFPVEPGATVEYQFDPAAAVAVFAISEGASLPVSVWEV